MTGSLHTIRVGSVNTSNNIHTQSTCISVIIVVVGMYVCFILQGVVQQLLYDTSISGQKFIFTGSLLFFTTLISAFIAFLYKILSDCISGPTEIHRKLSDINSTCTDTSKTLNEVNIDIVCTDIPTQYSNKTTETSSPYLPEISEISSQYPSKIEDIHRQNRYVFLKKITILEILMKPFYFFNISTAPVKDVFLCSATFVVAKYLGWHALTLVDFPTQSLGKCAKPVAILLLSLFIPSRKYKYRDVMSAIWITISLFIFNMAKINNKSGNTSNTIYGNILLIISLVCEGLTGTRQDKLAVIHDLSNVQLMFAMNFSSSLLLFPLCVVFEFSQFFPQCLHTLMLSAYVLMFCTACAIGQLFMYASIKIIGAMHTSIVTTTKKLIMVLISVYILHITHKKHTHTHTDGFTSLQWGCVCSVAASVLIHAYISKSNATKDTDLDKSCIQSNNNSIKNDNIYNNNNEINNSHLKVKNVEEIIHVIDSHTRRADMQTCVLSPCTGSTTTPNSSARNLILY